MNAKRFIAPDMRRALKLVREKLGDNAVILQNKTIPEGVELIATNEEVSTVLSSFQQNSAAARANPGQPASTGVPQASVPQTGDATSASTPGAADAPASPSGHATVGASSPAAMQPVAGHGAKASLKDKLLGRTAQPQGPSSAGASVSPQGLAATAEKLAAASPPSSPSRAVSQAASEGSTDFSRLLGTLANAETVRYNRAQERGAAKGGLLPAEQVAQIQAAVAENYTVVIDTLKEEVDLLRRLLTTQAAEQRWEHFSCTQPLKAHLLQQLIGAGYLPNLSRAWVEALDQPEDLKSAWKALLKHILSALPIAPEGIFKHNEAVALVGPTGAGKTSTIGKLAAAFVLNGKAQDLAIISTDAYRIGAQDQLRTLCQILSVPLTIVDDHMSLRRALDRHAGRRKVLVDTAGLTQQDPAWQLQLQELESCRQSVASYMVMSTTHQLAVHVKALQDYASLPLAGCILTKLDECGRLGDTLSAVIQAQLPIAFTTTGLRIPEDLECADALKLIKQSLSGSVGDCLDPVLAQSCFQSVEPAARQSGKDVESLLNVCGL